MDQQPTLHDVLSSAISLVRCPSAKVHDRIAAIEVMRLLYGKVPEVDDREIPQLVGLIFDHIHEADIVQSLVALLTERSCFDHPEHGHFEDPAYRPLLHDIGRHAYENGADATLFRFAAVLGVEAEELDLPWIERALRFAVQNRKRRVGYVLCALSRGSRAQWVREFIRGNADEVWSLCPVSARDSLVRFVEEA